MPFIAVPWMLKLHGATKTGGEQAPTCRNVTAWEELCGAVDRLGEVEEVTLTRLVEETRLDEGIGLADGDLDSMT